MARAGWRWGMLGLALCFSTMLGNAAGQEPPEFARKLDVFFERMAAMPASRERDDAIDEMLIAFSELPSEQLASLDDDYVARFGGMFASGDSHLRCSAARFLGYFGRRARHMLPLMHRLKREAEAREAELIFRTGIHESDIMGFSIGRIEFDLRIL